MNSRQGQETIKNAKEKQKKRAVLIAAKNLVGHRLK